MRTKILTRPARSDTAIMAVGTVTDGAPCGHNLLSKARATCADVRSTPRKQILSTDDRASAPIKKACPDLNAVRSTSQSRAIAMALYRAPLPELTKRDIERRWKVGADTVRKILRAFGADPGPDRSLSIPIFDILRCEGISDPLSSWISATPDARNILTSDLLTLDEWLAQEVGKNTLERTKYYRALSCGRLASIRIGKQHRFRPSLQAAVRRHSATVEADA